MANLIEIKGRIKSIQDTMKITNAMYMISTTQLRKAKKHLEETEPYFITLQATIARILRHLPDNESEFFNLREKKQGKDRRKGFVVITADKGLAGPYNHNVLKYAQEQIELNEHFKLYVIGEAGRQFFVNKNIKIDEEFNYTAQNPSLHRARNISEILIDDFKKEKVDEVYIIYTNMKNNITTETEMLRLLPLMREDYRYKEQEMLKLISYHDTLAMLPSPQAVLENIVPTTVMGYIYGALVASLCSEQNSRMIAMNGANKNGSEMIHDLSIELNRMRQAMITQEITEVVAGAKAQKKKRQKNHMGRMAQKDILRGGI